MSDTPRTEARVRRIMDNDGSATDLESFTCQLERELNAANERIKRLEAAVNDPHALWTNWLRGTVKLPEGIGDVRRHQERIKRLEEAGGLALGYASKGDFESADEVWSKAKEAQP